MSSFTITIQQNGKPVADLQPYLGAASHIVTLNQNAEDFAHVHAVAGDKVPQDPMDEMAEPPAKFGPNLAFSHRFSRPGL
jgi:Cu+-exporting ATPase